MYRTTIKIKKESIKKATNLDVDILPNEVETKIIEFPGIKEVKEYLLKMYENLNEFVENYRSKILQKENLSFGRQEFFQRHSFWVNSKESDWADYSYYTHGSKEVFENQIDEIVQDFCNKERLAIVKLTHNIVSKVYFYSNPKENDIFKRFLSSKAIVDFNVNTTIEIERVEFF